MDLSKEREVERLLSAIYDDGASQQELQKLESLLADDPELQEAYWQFVSAHVALGVVSTRDAEATETRTKSLATGVVPLSRRLATLTSGRVPRLAAAVLLFAVGMTAWNKLRPAQPDAAPRSAESQSLQWTVERIPTITHVSWDGPSFSRDDDQWQLPAGTGTGPISLKVRQRPSASGYLFCLPPGAAVELVATFDATGENCLSVAELVGDSSRPVRKATFNNSGVGPRPLYANPAAKNRRYGVLGRWSERNDATTPRYFLLTGSHKLAQSEPKEDWRLSEMSVLLEKNDVIHIGWDDSGPAPPAGKEYQRDDDFDDLTATLIISSEESSKQTFSGLDVIAADSELVEGAPPTSDAYRVTLAPGELAFLKVSSEASAPNALFVVDASSGAVAWACSNQQTRSLHLGSAAVRNLSAVPREFLIVAANAPSDHNGAGQVALNWQESTRKRFYEQAGFEILGFEDDKRDGDFNDIRVSVLRINYADLQSIAAYEF